MSDSTTTKAVSSGFTGWKKKLTIVLGAIVALVVVLYFVATSAAFLKGFVLPRASKTLNASITIEDASVSPFSAVSLQGLKVVTTGEPLLEAKSAQVRYSLWDIIKGRINVSEMTIDGATVKIVQNADGTSNLEPILKAVSKSQKEATPKPAKPASPPPALDLKNIALKNAAFSFIQHQTNNNLQTIELASINLTIDQVRNGISGKLNLSTDVNFDQKFTQPAAHHQVQVKASAGFDFVITPELMLQSLKGSTKVEVQNALGQFVELKALSTTLDCDLTPTEIKQLNLSFAQAGDKLGAIQVSGPFDLLKLEGKLKAEILAIDRRVLNMAGAPMGIDFGPTQVTSSNEIVLEKAASVISVIGQLNLHQFSVTQKGNATVPLDLTAKYDASWDKNAQTAFIKAFSFDGKQKSKQLLLATLAKPMKLSLKGTGDAVDESALDLEITGFNLADWKTFAGPYAPAGIINLKVNVLSQQAGKKLSVKTDLSVQDLTVNAGSNHLDHADIVVKASTQVDDFKHVTVPDYHINLDLRKKTALTLDGSAKYEVATGSAELQPQLQVVFAPLLAAFPVPGVTAKDGALKFSGNIKQQVTIEGKQTNAVQTITGNLSLADFTGNLNTNTHLEKFSTAIDCDLTLKNQQALQIGKLNGALHFGKTDAGTFAVSGNYDLKKSAGQVQLKVSNVNEATVLPFIGPALGDISLTSMNLNLNVNAGYDPAGESKVKADIQLANLLLKDKQGKLPAETLAVTLNCDISAFEPAAKTVRAQIRQLSGSVTQGGKAAGKFDVSGNYDAKKQTGQFAVKLQDLNELALRPALASALGDKTLQSISLNISADAQYNGTGASSVKADVKLANLVIKDPKGQLPATPLSIQVGLDGSLNQQILDLRQLQLTLTPTARAKNILQLSGRVDMSKTNVFSGNLKLAADSLDVTPYYDLFTGSTQPEDKIKTAPEPVAAAKSSEQQEPAPVKLPLKNFTVNVDIGKFYLREVELDKWQAALKLDESHVVLNPFSLSYNNAPLTATADVNLAMPGYQYDLTFGAKKLPLEPLVNTFSPSFKGRAKGDIFADVHVKGAGTTGVNLKKNLTGQIGLSFTNANIVITESTLGKIIIYPIAAVLQLPDMLNTPLDNVGALVQLGDGKVNIKTVRVHSPVFIATTQGVIPINDVITNSPLNLPITVALPQNLAKRFSLTGTMPNEPYAPLPDFVKVTGTIGKVDTKIDKVVITELLARAVLGTPAALGGGTGNLLKNIGNALSGQPSTPPPANTNTNAAPTNSKPVITIDPFGLFKKKK